MTIAIDGAPVQSTEINGSSTKTFPLTVGAGSNRCLLVGVAGSCALANTDPVTGITFNGVAMTRVAYASLGGLGGILYARAYIYQLAAPASGTHDVVVSLNTSTDIYARAVAAAFTGVDQTTPVDHSATASDGNTTNPQNAAITVTSGGIAMDMSYFRSPVAAAVIQNGATSLANIADWYGNLCSGYKTDATQLGWSGGSGTDQFAMAIAALKPSGGGGATATTLSGPSSGLVSVPSSNFTVGANGAITGTVVVTPSDGGAGGTFTPTTVSISSGSPTGTFTYTPPATPAVRTISTTNGGGLGNPSSIAYNAVAFAGPRYRSNMGGNL